MFTSTVIKKLSMATTGVALLTLGAVTTAQAETVVVPNSLETQEGNSYNSAPFGFTFSQRIQQVYAASEFASLSEPELITQILFRPDAVNYGYAFSGTIPSIQINLSTTSAVPDGLSETFADNVGSNDTIVFSGPLLISSANTGPTVGPKDFDVAINLSTPFLYNPSEGNLLLDVRNFFPSFSLPVAFDSEESVDSISRVYNIGNVYAPTGGTDTIGLATKFVTQPVPEPASTLGLLAFGALGAGSLLKRFRQQKGA